MENTNANYIYALKYGWLTRLYDPMVKWTTREATFKMQLVQQVQARSGQAILDLACGTATLTIHLKKAYPEARVTGIDGDPKILELARRKLARQNIALRLDHGLSYRLPYPDASFDHVVSSLFFHHLTRPKKQQTLQEIYRVLKPAGRLHVADLGEARNRLMRTAFFLVQLLDGFQTTRDNVSGHLLQLFRDAGFANMRETAHFSTLVGTLSLYSGVKSAARA